MEILLILALVTAIATVIVTVKKASKLTEEELNNGINIKIFEVRMTLFGGLLGSFMLVLAAMVLYGDPIGVVLSVIPIAVILKPLFASIKILRLKLRNDNLEAKIEKIKKMKKE